MDFDITKVTIDGDIDDLSEDELRTLVSKFQDAQDSNVAEFQNAAEALDDVDEDAIEDFEKAREGLIDEIVEAEAFDEVPLTEDKLETESFSDLQEWRDFVADAETETEDDEEAEEDIEDFGKRSPKDPADDKTEEFVEEHIGSMQGVNL